MKIETNLPLIEKVLSTWRERIGLDYEGYKGHVYRVYNFCLSLRECSDEEMHRIAVAACFHDIGLWSDNTLDYIPPSVAQVQKYLSQEALESWTEEVSLMVEMHHKIRPYPDERYPLVEVFRKADLIDVSLGFFKFGLPRHLVNDVRDRIPNAGFHRFLMKAAKQWFFRHPFRPPPFLKW